MSDKNIIRYHINCLKFTQGCGLITQTLITVRTLTCHVESEMIFVLVGALPFPCLLSYMIQSANVMAPKCLQPASVSCMIVVTLSQSRWFNSSTLVPHICVSDSGQHWFRWWLGAVWLVAYTALSHHLKQCWVIVNCTITNKLQRNFNQNTKLFIQKNAYENIVCEIAVIVSRGRSVTYIIPTCITCIMRQCLR